MYVKFHEYSYTKGHEYENVIIVTNLYISVNGKKYKDRQKIKAAINLCRQNFEKASELAKNSQPICASVQKILIMKHWFKKITLFGNSNDTQLYKTLKTQIQEIIADVH